MLQSMTRLVVVAMAVVMAVVMAGCSGVSENEVKLRIEKALTDQKTADKIVAERATEEAKKTTAPQNSSAGAVAQIAGVLGPGASACIEASTTMGHAADIRMSAELVEKMGQIDGTVTVTDLNGNQIITVGRRCPSTQLQAMNVNVSGKVDVGGKVGVDGNVKVAGDVTHKGSVAHSGTVDHKGDINVHGTVTGTIMVNGKPVTVREWRDQCGVLHREIE